MNDIDGLVMESDPELGSATMGRYEGVGDEVLCQQAMRGGTAVIELTRRALDNPALLARALAAIDGNHTWQPKSFPPPSWLAALRILASDDTAAKAALLERVRTWDALDQQLMFEAILPRGRRAAAIRALADEHGWTPAFAISG